MPSVTARPTIKPATSWFQRFARSSQRYVGIDVGIDEIKVSVLGMPSVQQEGSSATPSLVWNSQWQFKLPVDPNAAPPSDWVDLLADQLADRLPRCVEGERNAAMIALPLPWIHYQTTPKAELSAAQQQCDTMFSASLFQSKAHLRHWPVVTGGDQKLIAATAEASAARIAEAICGVGYVVQGILPHGVALLHAAPTLTSLRPAAVILLELSGGLVALRDSGRCGMCRSLPARSRDSNVELFVDELEPWLEEIASEVKATFRYASRLGGKVDWESPLLICGGAASIDGVDSVLATMLDRPVATWRYAGRRRPDRASDFNAERSHRHHDATLAVPLSLACCGVLAETPEKEV